MTAQAYNIHGNMIRVSVVVSYRGFSISLSTIPERGPEIVVFGDADTPDLPEQYPGSAEGFRKAMADIDELLNYKWAKAQLTQFEGM